MSGCPSSAKKRLVMPSVPGALSFLILQIIVSSSLLVTNWLGSGRSLARSGNAYMARRSDKSGLVIG